MHTVLKAWEANLNRVQMKIAVDLEKTNWKKWMNNEKGTNEIKQNTQKRKNKKEWKKTNNQKKELRDWKFKIKPKHD